jgi:hypothetical protein
MTQRWREMDSTFRFPGASEAAGALHRTDDGSSVQTGGPKLARLPQETDIKPVYGAAGNSGGTNGKATSPAV